MKDFLTKLIASKEAEKRQLEEKNNTSQSIDEVREIGKKINSLNDEIRAAKEQLDALEARKETTPTVEDRSFNPIATYSTAKGDTIRAEVDTRSTMEYRKAFMDFVQKGTPNEILTRADAEQVSSDLGILLPNTIIQDIIKGVEKVYGQLYSRVKKTNVKGGVDYPIGAFSASLYWEGTAGTDVEHGVSEKQKAGGVTSYISFRYHIGEIRIAQSLLQSVLSIDLFEKEIVNALIEAYVREMDHVILLGNGQKQPEGILTEANKVSGSRIPAANIITFTPSEMEDWTVWQKKLFAKIPLSMRSLRPEFVFTPETWESNIMTLKDLNNRPVYHETYNPVTGDETATFKGRQVVFVEEGGIVSFDGADAGEYFGMYWVPEKAYMINSNMQFGYKKYFDEATNQYITKALVIVDGKVLDGKYIWLLKKAADTETTE